MRESWNIRSVTTDRIETTLAPVFRIAFLAIAALALAACSGGDDGDRDAGEPANQVSEPGVAIPTDVSPSIPDELANESAGERAGGGEPAAVETQEREAAPTGGAEQQSTDAARDEGLGPCPSASSPAQSLEDYLVITLRIEAELNNTSVEIGRALYSPPSAEANPEALLEQNERLFRDLARLFGKALQALCDVPPPAEAEGYHATLLAAYGEFADAGAAAEAEGVTVPLIARIENLGRLTGEGQRLVIRALREDGDDRLNAYFIALTEARLELAEVLLESGFPEALFFSLTEAGSAVLEELVETLEAVDLRLQELEPPPEARELHQLQLEVNAAQIEQLRQAEGLLELGIALQRGEVREADVARAMGEAAVSAQEFAGAQGHLSAVWYELVIEVLGGPE